MAVFRVTTSANYYGQTCQNVMHFDSGDDSMTPDAVAIEVQDEWIGTVALKGVHQWHPANIRWLAMTVQKRTPTIGVPFNYIMDVPGVQATSTEGFLTICTILRIQTATPGRTGHGRIYLPGVMAGFTTNGFLDDTFAAFSNAALTAMRARFLRSSGTHGPLVIGVAPRNNSSAFKDATALIMSPTVGNQRRRNIGIGI